MIDRQLENLKNFQYNIIMKSQEELKELAYEIASLEEKLNTKVLDRFNQSYLDKIENIIEGLSEKEIMALDGIVLDLLEND